MKVRLFDWCYVNTSFGDKSRVLSKSETMYAACLLVKKSKQIYFEERLGLRLGEFLLGGEDTELSYRLHAQGIKIGYSSQLKAFHGFSKARLTFFYLVRRHCKAGIENAVISSILNREEIFPSFREHMQFLKANTQFFVQYCILNVSYYLFYKLAKKMLSL
jgi:GT2 family glycosyltransferase